MLEEEYLDIINQIIKKYGKKAQVLQAIEEMSELTKELIKDVNRDKENYNEILEEIADVTIMIFQLLKIYKINGNVLQVVMKNKLNRQKERMENE